MPGIKTRHAWLRQRTVTQAEHGLLQCDGQHIDVVAPESSSINRAWILSPSVVAQFYAMVSFTNPGVLGTPSQFRRHFEAPILAGREPDADDATQVGTPLCTASGPCQ